MKNNKFTNIPSLIDNNSTINDPLEQSNIFNQFFASKSSVPNSEDPVPLLQKKEGIVPLNMINTSSIEIARIIRKLKRSYMSYCGVPGKFIHLISTPISFSLSRLFNNLFEIGHFPDI